MNNELKKLVLNQQTLRNLTHDASRLQPDAPGTHTCHNGACPSHHPPHCDGMAIAPRQR